jgi:PAS domain S-box-containing protein
LGIVFSFGFYYDAVYTHSIPNHAKGYRAMDYRPKILIVDDEPRICESLKLLLAHLQYEIHTCHCGRDAIHRISAEPFDLVLLDIFMHDVNGYQVLDYIKRYHPDITVIMMTGTASVETVVTALRKGVYDYLLKPFESDALIHTIKNAMDFRRLKEEHRQSETALRQSEEKYRRVFECTGTATILIQKDLTICQANAKAQLLTGYGREEIEDRMKLTDFIAFKDCEHICSCQLDKSDWADIPPCEYECRLVDRYGAVKNVIIQINRLSGTDKSIASITDLTLRKKTEEALKESEEKYRTIIESIDEGYFEADIAGKITFINEPMSHILGLAKQQLLGLNARQLFDRKDSRKIYLLFHEVYQARQPRTYHGMITKRNGQSIHLEASVNLILDESNRPFGYRGIIRDVTAQRTAEAEKRKLETQLQQAQKMEAIGTLAGGIAHDFNNILSAILGYSELSLSDVPPGTLLYNNLLRILNAGERARDLVKQILTFSRQAEHELLPIQIKPIIKEALKLLRASLPATIDIQQNIRSDATVLADPTQIHQILMNLCTNASHAMQEPGGRLEITLENVNLDSEFAVNHPDIVPGLYVQLAVTDNGHGMDATVLERIFDPFFTTKERGKGTGMGLAVVHGIVKTHHGAITVLSKPGKGSIFSVYIPVIEGKAESVSEKTEPIPTGSERILFVDDEHFQQDLGRRMLERLGYDVTTCTDGRQALSLFRSQPDQFDLIITDMTMPMMTGDVLTREIMVIRPDIPIIICTGYSERITEEKALAMGAKGFVLKPIVIKDMANLIRKALLANVAAQSPSIKENSVIADHYIALRQ